ncbi:restriction endonuclease subunit S [Fibrobacter sp.]|uniref:restriction endonuclease subunit S n=1 Tax=Fibrobacter sp. TaxID=35828 RepID=UPI0025C0D4C9|nr:restriction endonuclease subunit S [Fibrobacter sp.]MBR4007460.1 restriction endonuclease subunit S [Fibrobacter sp.]
MKETKFKQTEVGMIPSDWEVKTLGELYKVHNGLSKGKQFFGHGYPFLSFSVVFNNVFIPNKLENLVDSSKEERASYSINKGDVFITRTSETVDELGMSCVALKDYPNATYNGFCKRLRPNDVEFVNLGYLGFYLRSDFIREWFLKFSTVTTRASLKNDELLSLPLVLPPTIEEQQRIANALSDVDTLIANLEKLIAKKKNIKQGAMQQLLTGRKRLPGFGSDERRKECHSERSAKREAEKSSGYKMTELGLIPSDWEVKKLSSVCTIIMGQSPDSKYYNEKEGTPLIQGNADIENRETFVRFYTTQITKKGLKGDLILTVRAPVGSVAKATFDCCLGRGVCALRNANDFLYQYLIYIEKEWAKRSAGSTFDSIKSDELSATLVVVPSSKEEQTAIANVLSDMDTEISALETKLAKYRTLKTGMMQQLLTGKIRLI